MHGSEGTSEAPSDGLRAGGARRLTGFDFARRTSKKGRREGEEPPSLSGQAQDPAQGLRRIYYETGCARGRLRRRVRFFSYVNHLISAAVTHGFFFFFGRM